MQVLFCLPSKSPFFLVASTLKIILRGKPTKTLRFSRQWIEDDFPPRTSDIEPKLSLHANPPKERSREGEPNLVRDV